MQAGGKGNVTFRETKKAEYSCVCILHFIWQFITYLIMHKTMIYHTKKRKKKLQKKLFD